MTDQEFRLKVSDILSFADLLEVDAGGKAGTYTHRYDAFELVKKVTALGAMTYTAIVWDVDGKGSQFASGHGLTEESAMQDLCRRMNRRFFIPIGE